MAKPASQVPNLGPIAPVGMQVMPVYDLNGRPLGFFPLAPGLVRFITFVRGFSRIFKIHVDIVCHGPCCCFLICRLHPL